VFTEDSDLHPLLRRYLAGVIAARLGRDAEAMEAAREAERVGARAGAPVLAASLARGVRARLAHARGRPADALAELAEIRSGDGALELLGIVPFHGLGLERFLHAEALVETGRGAEAEDWYASFGEHSPFGRVFLAHSHLRRAGIAAQRGDAAGAILHHERFVRLWRDADAELQPMVAEASRRVRELKAAQ
jgi:hypothetical protein